MMKFVTTAIDYVNSLPHIGTAYEKIGADVLVRFLRFCNDEVYFQMGNDEHSANVQKAAEKNGVSPKQYCDEMRPQFENVWKKLDVSYDSFVQTSEPRHHRAVLRFYDLVKAAGDIAQKDYAGWYCEGCETFLKEKDLLEGELCPNHKTKPLWLTEKNYFFNLPKYADQLLSLIESGEFAIYPASRRNEVLSFIKGGLEPISISRSSFTWGIPLPDDSRHVFYVWFDALINYLTGLGFGDDTAGWTLQNWISEHGGTWQNALHIVGKDITRFHCVIWPAMLLSAGLPLPKMVFGHGFVYLRGEKMSKSLGNVVTPLDVLDRYPDFGSDALRYVLMRGSSFGEDGDFTWESFIERYNADLANGLGNLASRILGMVWKYQNGVLRAENADDETLLHEASKTFASVKSSLDRERSANMNTHAALAAIWEQITRVDKYIDGVAPWKIVKEGSPEKLSQVLTQLVEEVRKICLLIYPFLPSAAEKIWQAYGFVGALKNQRMIDLESNPVLQNGQKLSAEKLQLFPRIVAENKN